MSDDRSRRDREEPEPEEAIRGLPPEVAPPPGLEERVVAALRAEGLLGARRRAVGLGRPARLAGVIAAGLVLFAAGWIAGRTGAGPAGPADAEPEERFLLLLYEGDDFRATPAEVPRLVREYGAWAAELRRDGRLVLAEKLAGDGRLLSAAGAGVLAEPAIPRTGAGTISGFYLIRARDYAEAVAIAGRSPHLRYGGTVSVRRIEPT